MAVAGEAWHVRIRNAKQFNLDVEKFAKEVNLDFRLLVKALAFRVFAGVVKRTPVDKGIARASWVIGVGGEATGGAAEVSGNSRGARGTAASGIALSRLASAGAQIRPFSLVVISNSVAYAARLESGSSRQAPRGMVAITLNEVISQVRSLRRLR